MMRQVPWILSVFFLLLALAAGAWAFWLSRSEAENPETITEHQLIMKKTQAMGNLELVRMSFQDVVQHRKKRPILADAKVMLIVASEAAGCIDLKKITPKDLHSSDSTLDVTLPRPEVCFFKVDHQRSQVVRTEYTFSEEAELIDQAYRRAERQIPEAAIRAKILERSQKQARLLLTPLFEALSQKTVTLHFTDSTKRIPPRR